MGRKQIEQLVQSVAALEVANRELIEALSDALTHDLRSPLLIVTNFGQQLRETLGDSLSEQAADDLERILDAGRHMMHIIDDLRDLNDVMGSRSVEKKSTFPRWGEIEDAWIELGVVEDEDDVPIYHVRDNGIGFDNADSQIIFQVFERLHSRTEFSGSGLGLATVERIVRRHGGVVWADGVLGEGAVFRFTLGSSGTEPPEGEGRP